MERLNNICETEEKLKSAKGIIFSDVDGVWLDERNNFSFPDKSSLEWILRAQSQGYAFVLNSDTGGEGLLALSREFGITSDICIAENGSYIQLGNEVLMIQEPDPTTMMTELRNQISDMLLEYGTVWQGDATAAIRRGQFSTSSPLFLVNTSRICTVGIYARQAGMSIETNLTDDLYRMLSEVTNACRDLEISQYPAIGSCLVRAKDRPTKADAVSKLIEKIGYSGPCFMIGDSLADDMSSLDKKVLTCAVGNASPELKTNAHFTDETAILERSAAEIINYIIHSQDL